MTDPIDILRRARDEVLCDKSKWCKGAIAQDDAGIGVDSHDPAAARFCTLGATDKAALIEGSNGYWTSETSAAYDALYGVIEDAPDEFVALDVPEFNDDPTTTYSDVISLFDRAIKRLEEQ